MISVRHPVISQLNYVREQLERRLMDNHDYLALVALDDAISQFKQQSRADSAFQHWISRQSQGSSPGQAEGGHVAAQELQGN